MEIMIQHARNMLTFGQKDQDHIITFALIQLCKQKGLEEIKHFAKEGQHFQNFIMLYKIYYKKYICLSI